jgi:hypothetical protein
MTHDLHPPGEPGRSDPLIGVTRRVTSMFVLWLWSVLGWRSDADRWHIYVTALASANEKVRTKSRAQSSLRWYSGSVEKSHAMVGQAYACGSSLRRSSERSAGEGASSSARASASRAPSGSPARRSSSARVACSRW